MKENWKWLPAREFVSTGDKIFSAISAVLPSVIAPATQKATRDLAEGTSSHTFCGHRTGID